MWILSNIYAANIISFKELDLDIKANVSTLIFGQNKDNANQQANGSGKSSLIEAIAFGITGSPLRDIKTEELINDEAEDAQVQLVFRNGFDGREFEINRFISRSEAQRVECHIFDQQGQEIATDKTVQASVNDYNRFVLEELGVSKDELYNNYILCRNHYKSFLDSSDKEKKEIINRFSNGIIVDEAIERLLIELAPVEEELQTKNENVVRIQGKIEALQSEIDNAGTKQDELKQNREAKITQLEQNIAQKRQESREFSEKISKAEARLKLIEELDSAAQDLEESDKAITECYEDVRKRFAELNFDQLEDYASQSKSIADSADSANKKIESLKTSMNALSEKYNKALVKYEEINKDYTLRKAEFDSWKADGDKKITSLNAEIDKIDAELATLDAEIKKNKDKSNQLQREIADLDNILYGTITCPKCKHEFLLNSEKPLETIKAEKEQKQIENKKCLDAANDLVEIHDKRGIAADKKEDEANQIKKDQKTRDAEIQTLYNSVRQVKQDVDNAKDEIGAVNRQISEAQLEIDSVNGKISNLRNKMFDAVFNAIDAKKESGKSYIRNCNESIKFNDGQIEQYQATIKELKETKVEDLAKSLSESKTKYEAELETAKAEYDKVKADVDALKQQQDYFVDFKSHLANQKIDAISAVTNNFLEQIGSDIRLQLEGFRKLKSGKIRDKITVKILRNGLEYGSFNKLSAGEKTRVYLANILAMQKITNANCEDGKGLDLLIVDELLDASDESGIMSYCDTLNDMGVTAFIITQGMVTEGYPYKMVVVKEGGISTIK